MATDTENTVAGIVLKADSSRRGRMCRRPYGRRDFYGESSGFHPHDSTGIFQPAMSPVDTFNLESCHGSWGVLFLNPAAAALLALKPGEAGNWNVWLPGPRVVVSLSVTNASGVNAGSRSP